MPTSSTQVASYDLYAYGNAHHIWQGRSPALGPSHGLVENAECGVPECGVTESRSPGVPECKIVRLQNIS